MKKTPRSIRVIATKITGGLHLAKKKPCQDFTSMRVRAINSWQWCQMAQGRLNMAKSGLKLFAKRWSTC